jgi:agmatinase
VPFGIPYGIRQVHYPPADAPRAIREKSHRYGRMLAHYDFDLGCAFADLGIRLVDCGDVVGDVHNLKGNADRAVAAIGAIAAKGTVPIVLGGDDSVSALAVRGLHGHAPVTVVQIDAHIDYRDEVNGVRDGYSSPMRRAAELPWVERIIHVGTRGLGSARRQDVADTLARGNRIVTAAALWKGGSAAVLDQVPPGANIHVVLDCDGLDPSCMPGTSAPMPGGLGYAETAELLDRLARHAHIVGFNVAEYYPTLDVNGITALGIVRLIVMLMAGTRRDSAAAPMLHETTTR